MTKIHLFAALLAGALALGGCAASNSNLNKNGAYSGTESSNLSAEQRAVRINADENFKRLNDACDENHKEICMDAAAYLESKGEDAFAAWYYDQTCSHFQYVPACLKLASMLETGRGVKRNPVAAQDIYKKACYTGDKESCKKFPRE